MLQFPDTQNGNNPSNFQTAVMLNELPSVKYLEYCLVHSKCSDWRRKWQPIPAFLPGKSQGQRSLVGCHLWGHTESDMTEAT